MIKINVGKNLEIIREHFNKSQTEMSNMLEISLQRYNNYEKERRRLPVEIAKKISEEFSLSLEAVFFANELFELLNFEDQKSA